MNADTEILPSTDLFAVAMQDRCSHVELPSNAGTSVDSIHKHAGKAPGLERNANRSEGLDLMECERKHEAEG